MAGVPDEVQLSDREKASARARDDALFIRYVMNWFGASRTNTLRFEEVRVWLKTVAQTLDTFLTSLDGSDLKKYYPDSASAMKPSKSEDLKQDSEDSRVEKDDSQVEEVQPVASFELKVSDEDVEWVMKLALEFGEKGAYMKLVVEQGVAIKDLHFNLSDVERALCSWLSYVRNKHTLEAVVERYLPTIQGEIGRSSIKCIMQDLNGQESPSDEEIDFVMEQPHANKHDLGKALSLWYVKDKSSALGSNDGSRNVPATSEATRQQQTQTLEPPKQHVAPITGARQSSTRTCALM